MYSFTPLLSFVAIAICSLYPAPTAAELNWALAQFERQPDEYRFQRVTSESAVLVVDVTAQPREIGSYPVQV